MNKKTSHICIAKAAQAPAKATSFTKARLHHPQLSPPAEPCPPKIPKQCLAINGRPCPPPFPAKGRGSHTNIHDTPHGSRCDHRALSQALVVLRRKEADHVPVRAPYRCHRSVRRVLDRPVEVSAHLECSLDGMVHVRHVEAQQRRVPDTKGGSTALRSRNVAC